MPAIGKRRPVLRQRSISAADRPEYARVNLGISSRSGRKVAWTNEELGVACPATSQASEESIPMKMTWYGHSAFRIEVAGATILIDPFLLGNPSWNKGWEEPAEGVTHVLITHGHNDHVGDALAILKKSDAMLIANYEICNYLVGQGANSEKVNPGLHGGTVDSGGFTTSFGNALHSSSWGLENGQNVYLGNPLGLVLKFPNEKSLYHMGDTDIFGNMTLIEELHKPTIGIVPIGDRLTMGGGVAALACKRFFNFETAIPCHYGLFPIIDQTADKFVAGLEGSGTKALVPEIGKPFEI
jgi:L-ascorbate metabolism protein UlaG (beta-lactamase superfamily)